VNSEIHNRLARVARDVLRERFVSIEDRADAMAAAIITEPGLEIQLCAQ
jgi:hypothetical protein